MMSVNLRQTARNEGVLSNKIAQDRIDIRLLKKAIKTGFGEYFEVDLKDSSLNNEEFGLAQKLKLAKYSRNEWNRRI